MAKSVLLQWFHERVFFHQCTDETQLDEELRKSKLTSAYIGFDCTAPSLHVGSLMQIMVLRQLQKIGIKPIVLLGGATTKIGDPSGKDESRPLRTTDEINNNRAGILKVLKQFIRFDDSKTGALLVDNSEWFDSLGYIEFLREVGRHFSVNRMLSFDSVKQRLEREQNLSFLEFNYMLFQAYDFVHLHRTYDCTLQIGGSDQWGNIVNGVELNRRMGNKKEVFGLTTPLITTSSGAKMGKTAQGAIWLSAADVSPYDYWQFWRNVEDADVGRFLRFFTELPLDEIVKLESLAGSEINQAKIILANEATKLCHGEEASHQAYMTAQDTFSGKGFSENLPIIVLPEASLKAGIPVYKLLLEAELAESGGEAKRLIKGGGARINDIKCDDAEQMVSLKDLTAEGFIKLSAGKKKHALIKIKH